VIILEDMVEPAMTYTSPGFIASPNDSPDPESDKTGPQFQPNIVDSEGERASVPDFPRYDAGFCREKQTHKQTQGLSTSPATSVGRMFLPRCDDHSGRQPTNVGTDTAAIQRPKSEVPPDIERQAGRTLTKWAWVELNYRPHAYQTA
jgi:hypothetical protein